MLRRWWLSFLCWRGGDARGLFRFHDGRKWRVVDPFPVMRALLTAEGFDWDDTPKALETHNLPIQLESLESIGKAVKAAFSAPELTETECLALLTKFRAYLGGVKKNGSLFPISPDSTESKSSDGLVAKASSVSGSTPTEPLPAPVGSLAVAMPV